MKRNIIAIAVTGLILSLLSPVGTSPADGPLRRVFSRIVDGPQDYVHRYRPPVTQLPVYFGQQTWQQETHCPDCVTPPTVIYQQPTYQRPVRRQPVYRSFEVVPQPQAVNQDVERLKEQVRQLQNARAAVVSPVSAADMPAFETSRRDGFHKWIIEAAKQKRKNGEWTFAQVFRFRMLLTAPNIRQAIKAAYIGQMKGSSELTADLPFVDADGTIDETAIDWGTLLPLLISLLQAILDELIDAGIIQP